MKAFAWALLVGLFSAMVPSMAKESPPKVQVYSHAPGMWEKPNTLICHVSGFHPPEITIELLKNRQEIPGTNQSDLAFEEDWHFHLTKHVGFTPRKGDEFACRVTHLGSPKVFVWEPDM